MESAIVGLGETPVKYSLNNHKAAASGTPDEDGSSERQRKRPDYLSWEDYFMSVACLSAQRSKDPSTQVGACIVNKENKVIGIGYNGMPVGCDDDKLPWGKQSSDPLNNKYAYACHAEMNAVMNKNTADTSGCRLYSTLFPCNECAKLIIQARITHVVYMHDKPTKPEMQASRRLFDMAGVQYSKFHSDRTTITIDLKTTNDGVDLPVLKNLQL